MYQEMLEVLKEFCSDVRAAGPKTVLQEWPDLHVTYEHAKAVIRKAKKLEGKLP